ncbi:MAG: hypothetical protein AVDCRST_MAG04-1912, partial [uncultured Acetobacteraceae bacterium]
APPPQPCLRLGRPPGAVVRLGLPRPPHHHGHRLRPGRQHGHRGAHPRGPHGDAARAGRAHRGGEPARRGGHGGDRVAEAPAAGRLHGDGDGDRRGGRRARRAGRRHALRPGGGLHPPRRHQHAAGPAGGDGALPRRHPRRRARPDADGRARQHHLRLVGLRRRAAPAGRDAGAGAGQPLRPRALPQRGADAASDPHRGGAIRNRGARLRHAAGARGQGARRGDGGVAPIPALPGHPDAGGARPAGLRRRRLLLADRARGHAPAGGGGAEPRARRLPHRPRHPGQAAVRRPRPGAGAEHARRRPRFHGAATGDLHGDRAADGRAVAAL